MKRRSKQLSADDRDLQGPYKRKCGSSIHDIYGGDGGSFIDLTSKKKIKTKQYENLIAR